MTGTARFSRYEIKYLIDAAQLPEIRDALVGFLRLDVNGFHSGGYYIHSIYFDSPDYHFYREKLEGNQIRIKPRIRSYRTSLDGPPAGMFLELKGRFDRIVDKRRSPIDAGLAERLLREAPTAGGDWVNGSSVLGEFQYLSHRFCLTPCVTVLYHRTPFIGAFYSDLRITFDRLILSSLTTTLDAPSEDFVQVIASNQFVMELKYNDKIPRPLLNRLNGLGLQQHTFSKYATSLQRCFRQINGHGDSD